MKVCTKCKSEKVTSEFHASGRARDGLQPYCKRCSAEYTSTHRRANRAKRNAYQKSWYAKNPEKLTQHNRRKHLKRCYGITPEQYDEILAGQRGLCAICGSDKPGGRAERFHMDHDHSCCPGDVTCGRCIRGLLCARCNLLVGVLESTDWRERAEAYIRSAVST